MAERTQARLSPGRMLFTVIGVIALIEIIVMALLDLLPFDLENTSEALVDAVLLGLLSTPLLWLLIIRPLKRAAMHDVASNRSRLQAVIASLLDAHIDQSSACVGYPHTSTHSVRVAPAHSAIIERNVAP